MAGKGAAGVRAMGCGTSLACKEERASASILGIGATLGCSKGKTRRTTHGFRPGNGRVKESEHPQPHWVSA
jgi:hypothetical protein